MRKGGGKYGGRERDREEKDRRRGKDRYKQKEKDRENFIYNLEAKEEDSYVLYHPELYNKNSSKKKQREKIVSMK